MMLDLTLICSPISHSESCLQLEPERARQVPATRRRDGRGGGSRPRRRRLPPLRSRRRSRSSCGPPHGVGKLPAWIPGKGTKSS